MHAIARHNQSAFRDLVRVIGEYGITSIAIPPLTADRRKELIKQAKAIAENSRTGIRNIRRDENEDLKKKQKAGEITEDDLKKMTDELQKTTDNYIAEINKIYDAKEKEIMD